MNLKLSFVLVALTISPLAGMAQAAKPEDLEKLTDSSKQCNLCDLSQADLSGMDLSGFQLVGANLNGANLVQTNLSGTNLSKASIVGANLAKADLSRSILTETTFVYSNLAGAKIQGAKIRNADFQGANLAAVNLSKSQIWNSTFAGANDYQVTLPRSRSVNFARSVRRNPGSSDPHSLLLTGENQAPLEMTLEAVDSNLESGTPYRRRPRSFKVPAYIGTAQRSSIAGDRSRLPASGITFPKYSHRSMPTGNNLGLN
jgi:uncharacterized protein YjbI with pentapeptide repeats